MSRRWTPLSFFPVAYRRSSAPGKKSVSLSASASCVSLCSRRAALNPPSPQPFCPRRRRDHTGHGSRRVGATAGHFRRLSGRSGGGRRPGAHAGLRRARRYLQGARGTIRPGARSGATGPAPSALVPRRADLPYRRPVAKASLQASLQAAAPQNIQQAVDALEANVVAASTRRALDSRIRFWLKLASTNGAR